VLLNVYDVSGRLVRSDDLGMCPAGTHTTTWDGSDTEGRRVASGVYFCCMEAEGASATQKIVFVK
jgi:flagellar hook assembly protein FlgD